MYMYLSAAPYWTKPRRPSNTSVPWNNSRYTMSSHPQTHLRQPGSNIAASNATHGSQTITQNGSSNPNSPSATLRLRGEPSERRRIQWAEDVVDNEGMGKKSSKVCCIYHKPHEPGDSESESSSSSESDSDSEADLSRAQKAGGRKGRGRPSEGSGKGKGKEERKPSPNAYERQPKYKGKKEG